MTYSDPLRMVVEPQREFKDFLETTMEYPLANGTGVILQKCDENHAHADYKFSTKFRM
jgi:hypothetical protein